jgi:flagellar hook-length control protein FliK
VINSNLDVLNLNASKPSLNKKADLSFNDAQANEFGDELASYENAMKNGSDEALSENVSLAAGALPNMKAPNQVSEENLKTLTENLNNFSPLKVALPEFNENLVDDLDDDANLMDTEAQVATNATLQGLINASANVNTSQVKKPVTETAGSNLNSGSPQINPQINSQVIPQTATQFNQPFSSKTIPQATPSGQKIVNSSLSSAFGNPEESPVLPLESQMGSAAEPSPLSRKTKVETSEEGKFSLEGFQKSAPQALSPEFAMGMKQNMNPNIKENPVQNGTPVISSLPFEDSTVELTETDKGASQKIGQASSGELKASPANTEMMALLQNLSPAVENQTPSLTDSTGSVAFAPIVGIPQQNQAKNDSSDSQEFSGKDKERKVDVMGTEQNFAHITEKHKLNEAQIKSAETAVALPTESQHKTNMDQIVTHARTFLKDGGGEMVMKLTPEGLGTVDLKVAVKDGQVSIEINTQNEHIKKMFEEGSKDLLGALEVQNLKVDSLKVNMADHIQKDMNMNQFNMSDKDFARNFMGQFRDERQGFRNQSLNGAMDKFHAPAKEPAGLRPSSLAMGNSSRLNVVA